MYKVEQYLPRCLDSVLNQTFSDWSAILVDDGSPDKSGKIADKYAARDKRFMVIHKENGGLSSARNAGMKIADGKYIMFLDSDDCIHPQTMEILYGVAEHTMADIVSFEYDRDAHNAPNAADFPPDEIPKSFENKYNLNTIKYKYVKNLMRRATNRDYGINAWWVQACMVTMRMYRRNFIRGLWFDQNMSTLEDVVFWSMVLLRNPSGVITRLPLYYYTVNTGSILHSGFKIEKMVDVIRGIRLVGNQYKNSDNPRNARMWYKRFMWDILSRIYNGAVKITNPDYIKIIVRELSMLQSDGILDLAPGMHARRYRRRILRFISQNS